MKVIKLEVGYLETNCYILHKNNKNIVIDPGDEFEKIDKNINGDLLAVLITHFHDDHVGALKDIVNKYACPVYEFKNVTERQYIIDEFKFEVIFNPGHTYDSISFYFRDEGKIFTGDFLFKETIGRTDLETGNMDEMINSLKKIYNYDNVIIYPGHGDITDLSYEKRCNPFMINLK